MLGVRNRVAVVPSSFALVAVLALLLACRGRDTPPGAASGSPTPANASELEEPALPDLSRASDAVRTQITEAFARIGAERSRGATTAEMAAVYGDAGVLLLAAGYYDAAEAALVRARASAAQDVRWPYYVGHVYRLRSEPLRAIAAFEDARRLAPDDVVTLVHLAEAHLTAGHAAEAETVLTEAVRRDSRHARALAGLGRAALARRDYGAAVQRLEEALRLDPEASALHYQLSLAYRGSGDATRAEAELKRRGTNEPAMRDPLLEAAASLDNPSMYDTRSREALSRGDWTMAMEQARRGLELVGSNATVRAALHHRLGTALAQTGDNAGARREFQASIDASPTMARSHFSLGVLHLASGETRAALAALSRALEAEPGYVAARITRGDVLRREGRGADALSDYARALELEPSSAAAQFGMALALAAVGRYADARDGLLRATTDHPGDRALTVALARVLAAAPDRAVRDPARALALVQEVVQREASFDAVETMARAFAEMGRFQEAAAVQGEAVAQARGTGQSMLANALAETQRQYQQQRVPRGLWRAQPIYEPTP